MKNISKSIVVLLLLMLVVNIKIGCAQDFYKDYIKDIDDRTKPNKEISRAKYHLIHKQFASEFKRLFNKVKRNTGFSMLNCDTLYFFETVPDYYSGGYAKLFWNHQHSCYYENPHFSPYYEHEKEPLKMEADAREKLLELGPEFKAIIQKADTVGYLKYIRLDKRPRLGDIVQFTVATKIKKHWHFFSSRSYMLTTLD